MSMKTFTSTLLSIRDVWIISGSKARSSKENVKVNILWRFAITHLTHVEWHKLNEHRDGFSF
jgi:hypothetical protein